MANYYARVQHKRDTSANWTAANPVLLDGEIIIVVTDSGEVRRKIGDGVKTYTQLPFDDEAVRNLVNNKHDKIDFETLELITTDDIDAICAADILVLDANEVMF